MPFAKKVISGGSAISKDDIDKINKGIEDRFNTLTSSQQQDSEVIDARDGEASLKARLDRDLEKSKEVYVNVEGNYISTESNSGYAQDVEILGNTLQNLWDISKIDVYGQTAIKNNRVVCATTTTNAYSNFFYKDKSKFKPSTEYTIIVDVYKNTLESTDIIAITSRSLDDANMRDILTPDSANNFKIMGGFVGRKVEKATTIADFTLADYALRSFISNESQSEGREVELVITVLEGDQTQNLPAGYLEGIASVGDKVEGQELYEIPVLSVGKNLANPNNFEPSSYITSDGFGNYTIVKTGTGLFIPLLNNLNLKGSTYIIKVETLSGIYAGGNILFYGLDGIKFGEHTANGLNSTATITTTTGLNAIMLYGVDGDATFRIQISENNITEYEPYIEDKLTILSPTPLEKVGDVADRIICKDGVWGVEKNVDTAILNGSEVWSLSVQTPYNRFLTEHICIKAVDGIGVLSSKYKSSSFIDLWNNLDKESIAGHNVDDGFLSIRADYSNVEEFKNSLKSNNILIKYITTQPQFIPLPHDQQVKLRTFAGRTNIHLETEIGGTIKAQVPKSLGATVNTHTEQINNLNKELDRVKKLEESTVSTVTTESDFTTVEATSNGYFEDVKLEGKTLVNLCTHLYDQKHDSVIDKGSVLNYTKHPHYTQCDFKLLQNLKQNTTYTVVLNVTNFVEGMSLQVNFYKYDEWIVCSNTEYVRNKGVHTVLLTTNENIADHIRIGKMNDEVENLDEYTTLSKDIIILEGDHTQNPPSYFEGLKSVGDGVDEIVVSSVNKLGYRKNIAIAGTSPYGIASNGVSYILEDIEIGNLVVNNFKNSERMIVATYDSLEFEAPAIERFDLPKTIGKQVVKINQKAKFALLYLSPTYDETTKGYIYQESDKKRLLYYNEETQTWEKPILREWDSIEKHADGKYYYHQRSGEVVFNGSENWSLNAGWSGEEMSTNSYYLTADSQKTDGLMIKSSGATNIISEVMPTVFINATSFDSDCVSGENYSGAIYIRINKSKVLSGIKPYLQQNPMRVVYQLAEEKVYECTNIDLITYVNETNYIVESGAIAPKTTLKVMGNISNVVRTLQEKVSVLESKFVEMFKLILAGDVQSLAYELYPEDFENIEESNNQE